MAQLIVSAVMSDWLIAHYEDPLAGTNRKQACIGSMFESSGDRPSSRW